MFSAALPLCPVEQCTDERFLCRYLMGQDVPDDLPTPTYGLSRMPAIALQGTSGWASLKEGGRFFAASPITSMLRRTDRFSTSSCTRSS
jgi:hypothetical protein